MMAASTGLLNRSCCRNVQLSRRNDTVAKALAQARMVNGPSQKLAVEGVPCRPSASDIQIS